jgi:hypothetical protein
MEDKANFNNSLWGEEDSDKKADPQDIRLLELLIQKIIKKLEENSCEPKVQDALKAIQLKHVLAPSSESEKIFWQMIDGIKQSEYERLNSPPPLEAQLLKTIIGLKDQVKNGVLPVKTITDTFNQGKSQESHLTYQRIGRLLSKMGFRKVRVGGNFAILWDQENIERMERIYGLAQTHESHETHISETEG